MNATATELLGYAAAGLVLATFSVRSITTLRSVAIVSNLLFIAYAACAGLLPVLVLHALLLPLNLLRLHEALAGRHRQQGRAAAAQRRLRMPARTARARRRGMRRPVLARVPPPAVNSTHTPQAANSPLAPHQNTARAPLCLVRRKLLPAEPRVCRSPTPTEAHQVPSVRRRAS